MNKPDYAVEIRRTLLNPRQLCEQLNLHHGAKKASRNGLMIRCPWHAEKTPSCHVSIGDGGMIMVHCFGCGAGGDALTLIETALGITHFPDVLLEAANLAGMHSVVDELRGKREYVPRDLPPKPAECEDTEYPPTGEVERLWSEAAPLDGDCSACSMAVRRRLDPERISALELAKALQPGSWAPQWASIKPDDESGRVIKWSDCGYRVIVPVYDTRGVMRSVRAWQIDRDTGTKRLPARGTRSKELVMANGTALDMLRGNAKPGRVVITEGEPDFLTVATQWESDAVLGLYSGSWYKGFADKFPRGCDVFICTDHDTSGDKYAAKVIGDVGDRCALWRIS